VAGGGEPFGRYVRLSVVVAFDPEEHERSIVSIGLGL
jgi:hypothetical protein